MPSKYSPTGSEITAKLERVYGDAIINGFDENGEPEYASEIEVNWDSQEGVTTTEAGLKIAQEYPDDHVYIDDNREQWAKSQLFDYRPVVHGQFVSVWDTAEIRTEATLHMPSGLVETKPVEAHGVNMLERQYFVGEDGEEHAVCVDCNTHILNDDVCLNPDCPSNEE